MDLKEPTKLDEQIKLLSDRNCIIKDKDFCKKVLKSISYYRLSAYFLPFKGKNDIFIDGTYFEKVYRIYEFDKKLRMILFSALEETEIYFRSILSYYHSHKYGKLGYKNSANFSEKHDSIKFDELIKKTINENSKIPFVKHHIKNYGGDFPLWVLMEILTFGMLSHFYSDLKTQDRKYISRTYFSETESNIKSWLRCLTDLRNICAHYGRLYYRQFTAIPANIRVEKNSLRRLYPNILALKKLFPDKQKWDINIKQAILALIEEYNDEINLAHIGFPDDII